MAKVLIYVASLVVLSRLLMPSEFGLLAMITSIVGFGELFRDFGLSLAAIRQRTLSTQQRDNLFWINTGAGAFLTFVTIAASPLISAFYGQPSLVESIILLSPVFLINGAATQFRVSLIRGARFGALSLIDVGSQLAGLLVAVVAAASSLGILSLVLQVLIASSVALVASWSNTRWLPSRPRRDGGTSSAVKFGANLLGVQLLTYVGRNIDNVLIGRAYGAVQLGLYSRAYQLYSQPTAQAVAPFTTLAVNVLSRVRSDPSEYRAQVLRVQSATNYAAFIAYAFIIGGAGPIVAVLLGDNWAAVVPMLQILGVGGLFQVLGNIYYWVFLAEGLASAQLKCVLVSQPLAILLIVCGLPFGVIGVCVAVSIALVVEWIIPATLGMRSSSLEARDLLKNAARPLLFALALTLPLLGLGWLLHMGAIAELIVNIALVVSELVLLSYLPGSPFGRDLQDLIRAARRSIRGRIS